MEVQNTEEENKINLKPLNEISIEGYKYKLKDTYNSGYCYRCIFSCLLQINNFNFICRICKNKKFQG